MAYFMVSYDLRKKGEFDYQALWDEFDRLSGVKFQESAYFVDLTDSAEQVKDRFVNYVHVDDLLMVVEFTKRPKYTKALKGTNAWVSSRWP